MAMAMASRSGHQHTPFGQQPRQRRKVAYIRVKSDIGRDVPCSTLIDSKSVRKKGSIVALEKVIYDTPRRQI